MLDEIAIERRACWDDKTNMFMGSCQEHHIIVEPDMDSHTALQFNTNRAYVHQTETISSKRTFSNPRVGL